MPNPNIPADDNYPSFWSGSFEPFPVQTPDESKVSSPERRKMYDSAAGEAIRAVVSNGSGENGKPLINVYDVYKAVVTREGLEGESLEEGVKRRIIGSIGENILTRIPPRGARTVCYGDVAEKDPASFMNSRLVNPESLLQINRKDLFIRQYFLKRFSTDESFQKSLVDKFEDATGYEITPDIGRDVLDIQRDIFQNFEERVKEWKESTKDKRFPSIDTLVNGAVHAEIEKQKLAKKGPWSTSAIGAEVVKFSQFLLSEQSMYIAHLDLKDEASVVIAAAQMENIRKDYTNAYKELEKSKRMRDGFKEDPSKLKEVWELDGKIDALERSLPKKEDRLDTIADMGGALGTSEYYDVVAPDSFLEGEEGDIIGVVEVKCYKTAELRSWIDGLKQAVVADRSLKNDGIEGLQVFASTSPRSPRPNGMMLLGFNPDAQTKYVNMARELLNDDPDKRIEDISVEDLKIILRFHADLPDELLVELGGVFQELGYKNFIIQKATVTEGDIEHASSEVIKRDLQSIQAQLGKNDLEGKKIFEDLSHLENW